MKRIGIVLALVALCLAPAAVAKDRAKVQVAGSCTAASTSKLKLSREDRGVEVEFEVDQNRVGVRWNVVLKRGGKVVLRTAKVTRAPSGSFEARAIVGGSGPVTATATRAGESCSARASI